MIRYEREGHIFCAVWHTSRLVQRFCKSSPTSGLYSTPSWSNQCNIPWHVSESVTTSRWITYHADQALRDSCKGWREWSREYFTKNLKAFWPQNPELTGLSFLQAFKAWNFQYDLIDESVVEKSFTELLHIHERYEIREKGDDARAVKLLYVNVPDKNNRGILRCQTSAWKHRRFPFCAHVYASTSTPWHQGIYDKLHVDCVWYG